MFGLGLFLGFFVGFFACFVVCLRWAVKAMNDGSEG